MPSLEPVRPSTLEWALEHLNVLTNMVRVLLDADRISVFLYNEESNELCALLNTSCEIRIPSNLGIAGSVFSTGKLINSRDPYNDTRFLVDVDKQTVRNKREERDGEREREREREGRRATKRWREENEEK